MSVWVTDERFPRLLRWWHSAWNILARRRKIIRAIVRSGAGVAGFHLGVLEDGYFEGKWEPSFLLTLRGTTSSQLEAVARELAREFRQLYVLVTDLNRLVTEPGGRVVRLILPTEESRTAP